MLAFSYSNLKRSFELYENLASYAVNAIVKNKFRVQSVKMFIFWFGNRYCKFAN